MTYFTKFPLTVYELKGKQSVVKDILRRAAFMSEYKPYSDLYDNYTIVDGDTPQSLAKLYYGTPFYHWVILMFNELHNPYYEWPIVQYSLESFCIDKYGADTIYKTRHHEIDGVIVGEVKEFFSSATWVSPEFDGIALAVSFIEYEEKLNDERRNISILRPELLGEFVRQFEESINV